MPTILNTSKQLLATLLPSIVKTRVASYEWYEGNQILQTYLFLVIGETPNERNTRETTRIIKALTSLA